jgi:hypothetical protein
MKRFVNLRVLPFAAIGLLGTTGMAPASMDGPEHDPVIRVEEDWQLVLNDPDVDCESPQFHTMMSPYSGTDALYFQVTWNYRELEVFTPGGLQLQVWNGSQDFAELNVGEHPLSRSAEAVSWTQRLEVDGAHAVFSIDAGYSQSWGSFGGESMTVRTSRPIRAITRYSPETSVRNSWISYGDNRVERLVLREVRYYSADGLVARDNFERVVFMRDSSND